MTSHNLERLAAAIEGLSPEERATLKRLTDDTGDTTSADDLRGMVHGLVAAHTADQNYRNSMLHAQREASRVGVRIVNGRIDEIELNDRLAAARIHPKKRIEIKTLFARAGFID
jgi:hypothetical protein